MAHPLWSGFTKGALFVFVFSLFVTRASARGGEASSPHATMPRRPSSPARKEPAMNIEIRDAALEARIKKQLQATGSATVEEVLHRLLETQEEQDRWLSENRETINAKIRRGIEQLDRGQGIPEDQLDAHLADLKAKPE